MKYAYIKDILSKVEGTPSFSYISPETVDAVNYYGTDLPLAAITQRTGARGIAEELYNRLDHYPERVIEEWHILYPRLIDFMSSLPRVNRESLKLEIFTPGVDVYVTLKQGDSVKFIMFMTGKDTAPSLDPKIEGNTNLALDARVVDPSLVGNISAAKTSVMRAANLVIGYTNDSLDKLGDHMDVSKLLYSYGHSGRMLRRDNYIVTPPPADVVGPSGLTPYEEAVKRGVKVSKSEWYESLDKNPSHVRIKLESTYGVVILDDTDMFWDEVDDGTTSVVDAVTEVAASLKGRLLDLLGSFKVKVNIKPLPLLVVGLAVGLAIASYYHWS